MISNDILTQQSNTVNPDSVYFIVDIETDLSRLLDDIYPFNGNGSPSTSSGQDGDQWIIVIDCQPANYARDFGVACMQYAEALRVRREHAERCPGDAIPASWYTVHNGVDDFSVDRATGKVTL